MAWEDILPAVGSAGLTVDMGFGSLAEYLTKYFNLNQGSVDPILFVQPLYVYKGGGFVAFDPRIRPLDATALKNPKAVAAFLEHRWGAEAKHIRNDAFYPCTPLWRSDFFAQDLRYPHE